MIAYLKALAARLVRRNPVVFPPAPDDPADDDSDFGVREPRRGGRGGQSPGVALEEPPEETCVRAHGADPGSPGSDY